MNAAFLLGRVLFGGFFLYSGINHFKSKQHMAGYTASKGVPAPELSVLVSGLALIVGGASVITGVKPKLGATALLGFLATVSPLMHDFWNSQDPQARQNDLVHFSKNVALLGAALALAGVKEPWPAGLRLR
jgi:putative oxidoreductase